MMSACQVRLEILREWDVEILELSGEALEIAYFFTLVRSDLDREEISMRLLTPYSSFLLCFG